MGTTGNGAAMPKAGAGVGYVPPHLRRAGPPGSAAAAAGGGGGGGSQAGGNPRPVAFSLAYDAGDKGGKMKPGVGGVGAAELQRVGDAMAGRGAAMQASILPVGFDPDMLGTTSKAASKNAKRRAAKKAAASGGAGA